MSELEFLKECNGVLDGFDNEIKFKNSEEIINYYLTLFKNLNIIQDIKIKEKYENHFKVHLEIISLLDERNHLNILKFVPKKSIIRQEIEHLILEIGILEFKKLFNIIIFTMN